MPTPTEFFSTTSIASLAAATAMIVVAVRPLHEVFKVPKLPTAFAISLIIAYLNVILKADALALDWVIAFFNGCLIFCTSLGTNEFAVRPKKQQGKSAFPNQIEPKKEGFFQSWLK